MTVSIPFKFLCAHKNIPTLDSYVVFLYQAAEGCELLQSDPLTHGTAATLGRFLLQRSNFWFKWMFLFSGVERRRSRLTPLCSLEKPEKGKCANNLQALHLHRLFPQIIWLRRDSSLWRIKTRRTASSIRRGSQRQLFVPCNYVWVSWISQRLP